MIAETSLTEWNLLYLYKDDPLRVIESYFLHMQSVNIDSSIVFVLFFFYSCLLPASDQQPTAVLRSQVTPAPLRFSEMAPRRRLLSSPSVSLPPNCATSPPL
jgi:hypothetical protein